MVMILLTEINRTEFFRPHRDLVSQSPVSICGGAG